MWIDAWRAKSRLEALLGPIALGALDLVLRRRAMHEWSASQVLAWIWSFALSCALWFFAMAALRRLARRSFRTALGVVLLLSLFGTVWLGSSLAYFGEFGEYPSWSDLSFLIEESRNWTGTAGLFSPWLAPSTLLGLLPVLLTLTLLGVRGLSAPPLERLEKLSRREAWGIAGGALVLSCARLPLGNVETPNTPDANFVVAVTNLAAYYATRTKGDYRASARPRIPELPPLASPPLNVLWVVEESLGRRRMSLYGYQRPTTPRLDAWSKSEPDSLLVFREARTNSGNTSVVLPELLTGLPPSASLEALHRAPFLWQYARAAGYQTLLLSAQSFRYASFADYFLSTPPERVFTADGAGIELANGGGMDDRVFTLQVNRELDLAIASQRPFFAVLQYNATHHPILDLPPQAPQFAGRSRGDRYDNAVVLLDRLLDDLKRRLADKGVLDRTLIVVTSDHGESLGTHSVHRTQSYYDEVLTIPIVIYVPERLKRERPEAVQALLRNRENNVQNLDLPPTVLDAMGLLDRAELVPFVSAMPGRSLLRPVSAERVTYALNNTAARHWANEGFGLVLGREKYIFSERGGHEFYDLSRDPDERQNLWASLPGPPAWVIGAISAAPAYASLIEKHLPRADAMRVALAKNALRSPVPATSARLSSSHGP